MQLQLAELDAFFEQTRADDTVVLTPNRRLVQFLQTQFTCYQISKGLTAWSSYPCFFLDDWLQSLWQRSLPDKTPKILMTKSQEIAIWLQVIHASDHTGSLFNPEATAEVARRAWYSLCQWQLTTEIIDNLFFNQWLDSYHSFCIRKQLIDLPSVVQLLTNAIAQGQFDLPKQLYLFAFDDMNPQLQQLLVVIEGRGVRVEQIDIHLKQSSAGRVLLDDGDTEIVTAATWAAAIVKQQPQATIGIVIPQLAQQRAKVERIFNQVFEPEYLLPDTPRHASGFNISAGVPLSSTAPISAALLALELNRNELTIEQVSQLLTSPFIGVSSELPARAMLVSQLRKHYWQLSIDHLSTALGEFGSNTDAGGLTEDLHQRLQNLHQLVLSTVGRAFIAKQAPSQWAQLFSQQLDILGWPGSRSLDTIEFQQLDAWQKVLLQLAGFDAVFASVTFTHAAKLLQQLAFDTHFQPQTGDSPVQLLGLFEAAGMLFDYLWVMHLDRDSWPLSINPNPLLPLQLQKAKQMPMSSIQRELTLAKQLTRRLQYSAPQVIFSHSAREGDTVLHPSPLIESVPTITATHLPCHQAVDYRQVVFASARLESFIDDRSVPLVDTSAIRGGVQILKDQAACPFRAFATHRLKAIPMVDAQPGLTAAERGNLVHHALDIVWRHLQSHAALIKLSDEALRRLIHDGASCSFHVIDASKIIGSKLKQLEIDRLCRLLYAWMQIEKQRAPFIIKYSETKALLTLAQLPIHVRYDRIDQLADGSLLVIDYKTAKSDIRDWTGLRPDEPQVPLYSIAHQQQVSAVAFGQIHVDQIAFKGISIDENTISGLQTPATLGHLELPDTWPEILDHWREVLTGLAEDFVAGFAEVKPKYETSSCRYCSLHSLCRIKQYSATNSAIKKDIGERNGSQNSSK